MNIKERILKLKSKILKLKDSKLKYYSLLPTYIFFIVLINVLIPKESFIWTHTLFMLVTIILGVYIIIEGDKFIPHIFKPKEIQMKIQEFRYEPLKEFNEDVKKRYEVL